MKIPFNIPYQNPNLWNDIHHASSDPRIFRNQGFYYQQAKTKLSILFNTPHVYLTPSCTHALETIAHLIDIKPNDEIILPAYTYVSTANAFALKGARLVFADTLPFHPSLDVYDVEKKISPRTKAIVLVHYGGLALDVDKFRSLAHQYNILLIEDAAHALAATFQNKPLGTWGDFAAISFHETKNLGCVQGGALIINNQTYLEKANMITQCGTNRLDFINKKTDQYTWVSVGTNAILAEPLCAILSSQLNYVDEVTEKRKTLWNNYLSAFKQFMDNRDAPIIHSAESNGHIFYLLLKNSDERNYYIKKMAEQYIEVTTHYQALHQSPYYLAHHHAPELKHTMMLHQTLVRLPLYHSLNEDELLRIIELTLQFLNQ